MKNVVAKLDEAKRELEKRCPKFPKIVVVLGSGLGELVKKMKIETEIPFKDLPHFRQSTVEGHVGRLVVGELDGVRIGCMQGRLHYYEGYTMEEVVFPYRLFAWAGAQAFLLTNASGGLRTTMKAVDFMLIRDHINLMGSNPLIGPNEAKLGARFPDMSEVYDSRFGEIARNVAREMKLNLHEGVYVGCQGPTYETAAEIKMYKLLGGDVVGMSTVPEATALHHMGKRILGISFISNLATGLGGAKLEHQEVLDNAKKGYAAFTQLIGGCLKEMNKEL